MSSMSKMIDLNQENPSIDKPRPFLSDPKCRHAICTIPPTLHTFLPQLGDGEKCSSEALVLFNFADSNRI